MAAIDKGRAIHSAELDAAVKEVVTLAMADDNDKEAIFFDPTMRDRINKRKSTLEDILALQKRGKDVIKWYDDFNERERKLPSTPLDLDYVSELEQVLQLHKAFQLMLVRLPHWLFAVDRYTFVDGCKLMVKEVEQVQGGSRWVQMLLSHTQHTSIPDEGLGREKLGRSER